MSNRIEIWREKKDGRRPGKRVHWDEDHYRISKPRLKKKTVPVLDENGKQKEEIFHARHAADGSVLAKETGLVFEEVMAPVLDAAGGQVYDVLVESIVNDSFIQHNREAYNNFIEENGERKDERYRTTN